MTGETRSLPEGQWLWRRLIVWVVVVGLWSLLAFTVARAPAEAAPAIAGLLVRLLGLVLILYLVAPSAQQLVELAAALRLRLRGGGR